MMRPVSRKSSSSKPRIVIAGVPTRTPEVTNGERSSKGTVLRLTVTFTSASRSSASLPVQSELAQVDEQQVRVRAAGDEVEPRLLQRVGERVGVRTDLLLIRAKRVRHRDAEARRLRSDRVHQWAALHSRHDGAVERLRMLLATEHEAAARAG